MGVSFTNPLWWLLLPALFALAWYLRLPWLRMSGAAEQKRRERRRLYTRLALLFLLVAALSGPGLVSVINRQAVVLALDVSASVGPAISEGERWIRDALAVKPPGASAGVVAFGRRALVDVPPGERPEFHQIAAEPGREDSRIGEALRFSRAVLPGDHRQRVVLLTDGRDTESGALEAARTLYNNGVRVDVVPVGVAAGDDIRLDNLQIPPRARVGENTVVEVVVTADKATSAELYLERDGGLVTSRRANLQAGENRLSIPVSAGEAGLHRYRVRVVAPGGGDVIAANNEAGGIQEVAGPPRVLILTPSPGEARSLVEALQASGRVDVTVAGPGEAPRGLTNWARYQAVFLVNTPAYSLGERAMQELETYVRDGGGGLVMVGGPESFGPGGYTGTPVERALPVDMDIKGRGELPSLGLVLVIDKSGSMGGMAGGASKIGLAREAAARSISVLTEKDRVGVLAFDSMPWWVIPPVQADDKKALRQQIAGIQAGGGTEIYPPLLGAYQALRDLPTQVKHIILLTDGISAGGGDYQALLSDLRAAGITLSTVAVGPGADGNMLQALADLGRGRFYATGDADNIPAIFTKETVMATRSFAVNEHFYPRVAASGALLRGLAEVPPLDGYITATPKDLAETLLVSPKGDPILAAWQYGLGRAVAWTPDTGGRWCASWAAGDAFPRLWGNVLSWILPAGNASPLNVETKVTSPGTAAAGQTLQIIAEDPGEWQQVRGLKARITAPDGSTSEVPLQPAGPGRYEVQHPVEKPGAYLVTIAGSDGAGQTMLARSGVVVDYPAEYRETGVDMESLRAIARAGGGTVLEKPEQAFADNLPPVRARRDLTAGLLAVAALLWLVDVAGRRLVLGAEERAALRRFGQGLGRRLRPGREREDARPAWTGGTLTKVRDMRRQRGEVNDRTATPVQPGSNSTGAGEQAGGCAGASAGAGAEQTPAGKGAEAGFTQTAEEKSKAGATKTEQTASRLLAAKRRGFKK